MNHYTDLDPYLIRQRSQEIQREVRSLRLEKRLREQRGSRGAGSVAFVKKGVRPLLREVHGAG